MKRIKEFIGQPFPKLASSAKFVSAAIDTKRILVVRTQCQDEFRIPSGRTQKLKVAKWCWKQRNEHKTKNWLMVTIHSKDVTEILELSRRSEIDFPPHFLVRLMHSFPMMYKTI